MMAEVSPTPSGQGNLGERWPAIRQLFREAFASSFHYSVAMIGEEGEPHIAPIGSLFLGAPGEAFYFEKYLRRTPLNLRERQKLCILAVNSSRVFWLRSLLKGRFLRMPAVRLYGSAGGLREATAEELERWQRRVRRARRTRGHKVMWRDMCRVRDLRIHRVEAVDLGEMTRDLWK